MGRRLLVVCHSLMNTFAGQLSIFGPKAVDFCCYNTSIGVCT